jgi:hypothetical protein
MFGFLKGGKININLNKLSFKHGEMVEGKVDLNVKKAKNARGVKVKIYAVRKERSSSGNGTTNRTLFSYEQPLDVEREYSPGNYNYDFKLQVPDEQKINIEGNVGTALNAIKAFGNMVSPTYWYIEAKLDVPGGLDINKKVQINVVN